MTDHLIKEFVNTNTFEYKQLVQESGADRRMVKIFSAQLGKVAEGLGSFFQRISRHILDSSPGGLKWGEIRKFETSDQKCQIQYEGGMGWEDKLWPLE